MDIKPGLMFSDIFIITSNYYSLTANDIYNVYERAKERRKKEN